MTSQSSSIVLSPMALKSAAARMERPISLWISLLLPLGLPR
jgi:hypothetical protein